LLNTNMSMSTALCPMPIPLFDIGLVNKDPCDEIRCVDCQVLKYLELH
jgi:hypothetical protein